MATTSESDWGSEPGDDGLDAKATEPWFELPPLPDPTDFEVFWEPGLCRLELGVRHPERVNRLAWVWVIILLGTVSGIGSLLLFVLGVVMGGGFWLLPAVVIFFLGLVLAAPFLLVPMMVAKRSATIWLTRESMLVEDRHETTKIKLELKRSEIVTVAASQMGSRTVLFGENTVRRRSFLGLRYGRTWGLGVERDRESTGVLASWEETDVRWLASVVTSVWGLAAAELDGPIPKARVANAQSKGDDRQLEVTCGVGVLLLAVLGPLMYFTLWGSLVSGWQSRDWPSVTGTVISAEYGKTRQSSGYTYTVNATYRYEARGQELVGDTVSFSFPDSTIEVEAVVDGLNAGDQVTVFFDPQDPSRSVLVPGVSGEGWIGVGFGVAAIVMLFLCLLGYLRLRRARLRAAHIPGLITS